MHKWDFTLIYHDENAFQTDYQIVINNIPKLLLYKEKITERAALKNFLLLRTKTYNLLNKLYFYASLKSAQNLKDTHNIKREAMLNQLVQQYETAIAWFEPAVLKMDDNILTFLKTDNELAKYHYEFVQILRNKAHILSDAEEKIISALSKDLNTSVALYDTISVSDRVYNKVKGQEVNESNWAKLISEAKNPRARQEIFDALYKHYDKNKYSYAQIYHNIVSSNLNLATLRHFEHFLDYYLAPYNINKELYLAVINFASKNNNEVKRYYQIKQKALRLKQYHTYDRFYPLVKNKTKYSYEEGKELFFNAIKVFPLDYQKKARIVLAPGRVDVYPQAGKGNGAFSSACSLCPPFIFLNYTNTLEDVFTLAHEAGHSIHTLYSKEEQPDELEDYSLFIAEIASTFNEHNLLDYLLQNEKITKNEKIALIEKGIENIIATFYRQALFAQYEYLVYESEAKQKILTHEDYSQIMIDLYQAYYGLDIKKEGYKQYVWAYIPHLFQSPFYVYQYATSFASSLNIFMRFKNKEVGLWEKYIQMLSAGGSMDPIDELAIMGINLNEATAYEGVNMRLRELNDYLERLLNE